MGINSKVTLLYLIAKTGVLYAQDLPSNKLSYNNIDFGYGLQKYSKIECDSFPKSVFSYNILSKYTLKTSKLFLKSQISKPDKAIVYHGYIGNIKITSYEYFRNTGKSYLELNSTKLYYQNVLGGNYKGQSFHLISAYTFPIKNKTYLSISVTYMSENNSNNNIKPMLFEVHKNSFMQIVVPGFVRTDSPLCFGDFDNDGNIDYAAWNPNNQKKLRFFTISNYSLKLNNNYYLTLLDNIDGYLFSIDSSKSYWTNLNGGLYNFICK